MSIINQINSGRPDEGLSFTAIKLRACFSSEELAAMGVSPKALRLATRSLTPSDAVAALAGVSLVIYQRGGGAFLASLAAYYGFVVGAKELSASEEGGFGGAEVLDSIRESTPVEEIYPLAADLFPNTYDKASEVEVGSLVAAADTFNFARGAAVGAATAGPAALWRILLGQSSEDDAAEGGIIKSIADALGF